MKEAAGKPLIGLEVNGYRFVVTGQRVLVDGEVCVVGGGVPVVRPDGTSVCVQRSEIELLEDVPDAAVSISLPSFDDIDWSS